MDARPNYRGSTLFLVRVWRKSASGSTADDVEWRGKVQRIVDGESRDFSSLQDLADLLTGMLSNSERR